MKNNIKCNFIYSIIVHIVIFCNAYAKDSIAFEKAQALMIQVDKYNQDDLMLLWSKFSPYCKTYEGVYIDDETELLKKRLFIAFQNVVKEIIQRDITIFRSYLASGRKLSVLLKTALLKLIGEKTENGILQDVLLLMDEVNDCKQIKDLIPLVHSRKENFLTVLKTFLVYLNKIFNEGLHNLNQLKVCYPIDIQKIALDPFNVPTLCQYNNNGIEIMLPNRGYVFGGSLINKECRGLDCSSFVSYCLDYSSSIVTAEMELIWKYLKNQITLNDARLINLSNDFIPIGLDGLDQIRNGDFIIWRSVNDGHVAIFQKWDLLNPQKFIGIDNCRSNDKKHEGIKIRSYSLVKNNYTTYILRKKMNLN